MSLTPPADLCAGWPASPTKPPPGGVGDDMSCPLQTLEHVGSQEGWTSALPGTQRDLQHAPELSARRVRVIVGVGVCGHSWAISWG